jgi:hypothetical protein
MDNKVIKIVLVQVVLLGLAMYVRDYVYIEPNDFFIFRAFKRVLKASLLRLETPIEISLVTTLTAYVLSFGLTPAEWSEWILNIMEFFFIKAPYYMYKSFIYGPIDFVMEGGKRKL